MCGIVGGIDFRNETTQSIVSNMIHSLNHRGPDDNGIFVKTEQFATIWLGHSRLAIQDLSASGHQPMSFNSLVVVFNGEIYNFREVRSELYSHGYSFESDCDTEVLIKAFDCWGIDCVEHFRGMFAFALYDQIKKRITIFRDRAGVKPLFYYWDGELLLFASELKAFHEHPVFNKVKSLNQDSVASFLLHGYIPSPQCIFDNTFKLPPGHYIDIDLESASSCSQVIPYCYWDPFSFLEEDRLVITEKDLVNETEKKLLNACKLRMVSDVPVGVFLSGGYDSSLITAMLQNESDEQLQTFTVGFELEKYDESPHAKKVADYLGTKHRDLRCSNNDLLRAFELLPAVYDEPLADESALPTLLLNQFASQYVKVAVSADGGDELFAGYNKHRSIVDEYNRLAGMPFWLQKILVMDFPLGVVPQQYRDKISKLKQFFRFELREKSASNLLQVKHLKHSVEDVVNWVENLNHSPLNIIRGQKHCNPLGQILAADYYQNMSDAIVTKVERASMHYSLEAREPLLDNRLYEFLARMPDELRNAAGTQKSLLKEIAHRYVPRELLERPKQGFSPPLKQWVLSKQFNNLEAKYFSPSYIGEQELFRKSLLKRLSVAKTDRDVRLRYNLMIFQMWYEHWML
ncbi:MAG: asparagine synthase (glutamine-hydrolyzing) [Oleiphilaceae bacterium]|nr:asparagine synthase (glutamine-hydrolyzing) [Oleiphilaceae bacterium]